MSRGLGHSPARTTESHTLQRQQIWLDGFEDRYEEAQRLASRERIRKAEERDRRDSRISDWDQAIFARQAAEQREVVRQRLRRGYIQSGERQIGGRWRSGVTEMGLRSEDNAVLKYFVTLVPKRSSARASWDKAHLENQCPQKILTLDYPYIELNRAFMAALRVDCDGIFSTPAACLAALTEKVSDARIPCLPHIVVADLLTDGRYSRPHFIWLLPQGSAVWRSEDERCHRGPIRLFDAVARGLAAALLDLGADPAAPTMTGRMKNPLSPFWHTLTPNADCWPTLAEYADYVDTSTTRAVLVRQAAAVQSGLGLTASNAIFDALREEGQRLLAEWHFGADARMRGSRAALADHLHEALAEYAEKSGLEDKTVSYVTAKVADYLVAHFDPVKLEGKVVNRGKLLDIVDGLKTVKERQQAGGRYSGKAKGANTLQRLREAHQRLVASGKAVTRAALAAEAGVSVRTVTTRWSEAVSVEDAQPDDGENRCIDKKVAARPGHTEPTPLAARLSVHGMSRWTKPHSSVMSGISASPRATPQAASSGEVIERQSSTASSSIQTATRPPPRSP
ncbi:hypothetical protein PH547_11090 [Rhizobium sp. CNPSo 3464]|uniref:hypothetical protein n=1 Tax=Rhizobium sp. CNPSo 3464 TaxID=3021406 RepID=UPI00254D62E4|nr:hypothetical protein [Rhizobium sp. CNPSo 3464]MDK4739418.1 hypothetical protein [Rhizobium sp. CNPSo 3464]